MLNLAREATKHRNVLWFFSITITILCGEVLSWRKICFTLAKPECCSLIFCLNLSKIFSYSCYCHSKPENNVSLKSLVWNFICSDTRYMHHVLLKTLEMLTWNLHQQKFSKNTEHLRHSSLKQLLNNHFIFQYVFTSPIPHLNSGTDLSTVDNEVVEPFKLLFILLWLWLADKPFEKQQLLMAQRSNLSILSQNTLWTK